MEDRLPGDLGFAGNAGEGVVGTQAAHEEPRGGQLDARQTWRSEGVVTDGTHHPCIPSGTRMNKA